MTLTPTGVVPGVRTENPIVFISSNSASRFAGTALVLILLALPDWSVAAGWTITGSMVTPREEHTATLLPNGMVLVTGGATYGNNSALATSELYDPSKGTWTPTGSLSTARMLHTATLMSNGKVLVVGGLVSISNNPIFATSCEVYDPSTGIWTTTGSPAKMRVSQTATLLADGKVLVAGGMNSSELHNSTEVYDPMT
jgi:N-acetylneuraminic acid mutarotase